VNGQPSPAPDGSALDALRQARASQLAGRRRSLPVVLAVIAGVVYVSAREHPGIGLHGASLVFSVGLAGVLVGGAGVRQTILAHRAPARVYGPWLALALASSLLLVCVQPTGAGAGACVMIVTIAMAAGVIRGRLGFAVIAAVLAVFAVAEAASRHAQHQKEPGFLVGGFSFVALFLLALLLWRFRTQEEQTRRLLVQMEQTRDAELRAAALAERQQLARDMHDVLAHSLSGLAVRLEGARLLAVSDPGDARLAGAIDEAHQLAKSGLAEARQAIGMLRDDELPGPGRLAALAAGFWQDTGVPCRFSEAGNPRELGSAVKVALYRVTQEALTNIRKHACPERVEVRLRYRPEEVSLAIRDFAADVGPEPGATSGPRGAEVPGSGYGLTGMRERAELLGGTLAAGPADGGFLVLLRVPA
jgi:signal transduction histidine kinase